MEHSSTHGRARGLSRRKRALFAAVSVLTSSAVCLFAAESFLWALGKPTGWRPAQERDAAELDPRIGRIYEPDPVLGWKKREGRFVLPGYGVGASDLEVTILRGGRRATEPPTTPSNRPVILLIGCSYTQGWAITDADTYAWKLQTAYPNVEFRNYGTGGYGTYQSLLVLERLLQERDGEPPALVIYGFIDSHEERNVGTFGGVHARGPHPDPTFCTLDAACELVEHRSECLWSYLPLGDRLRTIAMIEGRLMVWKLRSRNAQKVAVTDRLLEKLAALCRAHRVGLVVAMLEATEGSRVHYTDFCRRSGIELVDCVHPSGPDWQVPNEGHPNGAMNALWADDLARVLGPRFAALGTARFTRTKGR